jgi:glucan endo-1,3-alpha-glucosidase
VNLIKRYIERFGDHPNVLRIDGAMVISTFAGENSLYGFSTLDDAWKFVKIELQGVTPVLTFLHVWAFSQQILGSLYSLIFY